MEDTEGERGRKRTQASLLSRMSKLRNIRKKKTVYCHFQEWHVVICDSVKSDGKIILTIFQIIWGSEVLPRFIRIKKMIHLMTCENHCFYWNSVSKLPLRWLFTAADVQWERAFDWTGTMNLNMTSLQKWWNVEQRSCRTTHSVQLTFIASRL